MSSRRSSIRQNKAKAGLTSEQLLNILECPICLEHPKTPPIHLCLSGHSVCSSCRKTLKKCGLCNKAFSGARNFIAENIVESFTFTCMYEKEGCNTIKNGRELDGHQSGCSYRPIPCNDHRETPCVNNLINVTDFISHLRDVHKGDGFDEELDVYKSIDTYNLELNSAWWYYYMKFDDKYFIIHTRIDENNVYWWMCVIGTPEEAKNYYCRITILPSTQSPNKKNLKNEYTVPVQTMHEKFKDIMESGGIGSVPKLSLTPFSVSCFPNTLTWMMEIRIFKEAKEEPRIAPFDVEYEPLVL